MNLAHNMLSSQGPRSPSGLTGLRKAETP
jgi:hypothetical protein